MASTKIINVLKSESFEDTLDLFRSTSASEVIFVLPKKAKAFSKDFHFQTLSQICSDEGKTATFMSSDENILSMAKKHGMSILSSGSSKSSTHKSSEPVATPVSVSVMDDNENEAAFERDLDEEIEMILPPEDEDELDDDFMNPRKPKISDEDSDDDLLDEDLDEELEDELDLDEDKLDENEDLDDLDSDFKDELIDQEPELDPVFSPNQQPVANFAMSTENPTRRTVEGIVVPRDSKSVRVTEKPSRPFSLDVRKESLDETSEDLRNVWQKSSGESLWANIGNKNNNKPWKQRFSFTLSGFSGRKLITSITIISGLALFTVLFLVEGKATVSIEPRTHDLNFSFRAAASDLVSSPDEQFNKIPGQVFKIDKSVSGDFTASGQKEVAQKARGTITVYNDLTSPQTLIATTRFQYTQNGSPSDLIFRSLTGITIPAKSTKSVEVIADKPGQSYNVAPGRFVIVAFKEKGDTQRYDNVYGQSNANFTGGISGNSKVVTESDYNTAKANLSVQLTDEVKKSISEQASELVVIQSQASSNIAIESSAQIDEAAERFSMTASGQYSIIAFKQEDLNKIIQAYVTKNNNLDVRPAELTVTYSEVALSSDNKSLEFRVNVKGLGYDKVPTNLVIDNLKGKNQDQVESYLKTLPFIKSVKVIFSPFWIRKVPLDPEKVIVKVI